MGKGPLSSVRHECLARGHGHSPASLPRTASCFPSRNQQPALLANLPYQHQLPPLALQGVPVAAVPLGRGCCPHAPHTLGGAQRGPGHSHTGSGCHGAHLFPWGQVVICCLWLLLGMHYDLPCQLFHWHCCTCCPSSCCPLCCPAACTGRAPTALSPLPSWPPGSCSDGFAFLVAIETQEWDEKTGPSMGLWAGLGVGQWAGWLLGAGLNRARQCQQLPNRPDSTLMSAVGSIATNGNLFWWHWQISQWPGAVGRKVIYQSQHGEEPHFAPALCPHEHSRSTVALVGGICRLLPADPFIPACLT